MSAQEISDERPRRRLPAALVWGGVGLAAVAVLVVLLGEGIGHLRLAVLLLAVSAVLIGGSVLLRDDRGLRRPDVEELVADEADALREQLRRDITVAARATHRAFGEKLQVIYEQLGGEPGAATGGWRAPPPVPGPVPAQGYGPGPGYIPGPAPMAGPAPTPGPVPMAPPGWVPDQGRWVPGGGAPVGPGNEYRPGDDRAGGYGREPYGAEARGGRVYRADAPPPGPDPQPEQRRGHSRGRH